MKEVLTCLKRGVFTNLEYLILKHLVQAADTTANRWTTADNLPVVMIAVDYDPFARGYVTSLARPTGNVTGIYFQSIELGSGPITGKELLIWRPDFTSAARYSASSLSH